MEITEDLIKRRSNHFDVACVQRLNLAKAGLSTISNLAGCSALVELNLSQNQISSVRGLPSLSTLRSLDLSQNALSSIEPFPLLPELEELRLDGNPLTHNVDWTALQKKVPQLRRLFVRSRAVAKGSLSADNDEAYHGTLQLAFPKLEFLDGEALALRHVGRAHVSALDAPEISNLEKELAAASWGPLDWTIEPHDAGFIDKCKKPLRALLHECESDLHGESKELLEKMQDLLNE
ncbi:hypothetical protein SPRG_17263 [Saprolegnia parasitica CBS 223.65]|uniref:Leucine-rich repeat and WD repeat-containing protein 1 LRR domain-containing protein n=1 Tax=Saprolegnia parasitica (strain CBS 223.65) TaxID=695850 RepID=A0A067BKS0_SAPPC|nr:hypothetical protein SPRG_17263 [Saprolegnia parasitica CBS 223.65]KDO17310.1 hypothetical protein SPRG_17263 [Saprolegnia parasitica CBS 223.65]|eukprot:XP_012211982.1 hypothetical protein SPRG_17263 [Saprolegnia parasitica CBS 223.65]